MWFSKIVVAAAIVTSLGLQAAHADICINARDIVSSEPNQDATSIIFKMRDGKTLQNDLQSACPDLRFYGFSWVLNGTDQVCDQQVGIKVINTGEICHLGKFKEVTARTAIQK